MHQTTPTALVATIHPDRFPAHHGRNWKGCSQCRVRSQAK